MRCETLIENFGCLHLSLRRICVPIWLIGKGFYFLDHWFIIIKGPDTQFCKSASGICFFPLRLYCLKLPPALRMLKLTGFNLVRSPSCSVRGYLSHLASVVEVSVVFLFCFNRGPHNYSFFIITKNQWQWWHWMAAFVEAHWFLPSRIPVITSKAVILLLPMQEWIPFSILKFLPHLVPRSIGYYRTLHELRATSITSHIKFT